MDGRGSDQENSMFGIGPVELIVVFVVGTIALAVPAVVIMLLLKIYQNTKK